MALRGVAIGRCNYLFAGAAIYSLIGTAKLNGVAPRGLAAPCAGAHRRPSGHRVDDFLPWHCASQITPSENHAASQRCDAIIGPIRCPAQDGADLALTVVLMWQVNGDLASIQLGSSAGAIGFAIR